MTELLRHAFFHALTDAGKLFPVLLATYLALEYLEQKAGGKTLDLIRKSGRFGPLIGALCGIFPQCGLAAAAANFYAARVISAGTLLAVFLSTSDDMLPVLIAGSAAPTLIVKILLLKAAVAFVAGLALDFCSRGIPLLKPQTVDVETLCRNEGCKCEEGILSSALRHAVKITLFVLVFAFLFNALTAAVGMSAFSRALADPFVGPAAAGLIGLVPNCSASVIITQLYLEKAVGFGVLAAGTLVGAGVGLLVLYRVNPRVKENLLLTGILYVAGVAGGALLGLLS